MNAAKLSREFRRNVNPKALGNELAGALFMLASFVEYMEAASHEGLSDLWDNEFGRFLYNLAFTAQEFVPQTAHIGMFAEGKPLLPESESEKPTDLKEAVAKLECDELSAFEEWFIEKFDVIARRTDEIKEEAAEKILESLSYNVPGSVADDVESVLEDRVEDIQSGLNDIEAALDEAREKLDEIESAMETARSAIGCGSIRQDIETAVESALEVYGERVSL